MTKVPSRHPRQLEMPLFVNLNARDPLSQKQVAPQNKMTTNDTCTDDDISLKATKEDLTIYRSISEGFLRRFK